MVLGEGKLTHFFRESADSTRWSLYYPQSTVCYLRVLTLIDNANKSLDSEDGDEIEVEDGDDEDEDD